MARQIRDAIGNVPLLLKIGLFPDAAKLSEFLHGIHAPSVAAVRTARSIIDEGGLRLKLGAVGGVSKVSDIADFFAAGAEAVLCGSSPMYLPHLAVDTKTTHPEW